MYDIYIDFHKPCHDVALFNRYSRFMAALRKKGHNLIEYIIEYTLNIKYMIKDY